jgi:hypothetical protein
MMTNILLGPGIWLMIVLSGAICNALQDQQIQHGTQALVEVENTWVNTPSQPQQVPEQTITTTIIDDHNPDEPWVVTTYRRPGESMAAFIKRHREMIEAVREALND